MWLSHKTFVHHHMRSWSLFPRPEKKKLEKSREERKKEVGKGGRENLSDCHGLMERGVDWRIRWSRQRKVLFDPLRTGPAYHTPIQIYGLHIKSET